MGVKIDKRSLDERFIRRTGGLCCEKLDLQNELLGRETNNKTVIKQ
jgi:hypothetical protein